jgi:glucose-1-phosphate adenylyltransferase
MQIKVMAFVLAGGKGTRLAPLTKERAKPAVPFGGRYRIIDFVLSNLLNSGIYSIYVLIQFKSQSLLQHLRDGWEFSSILKNQFIIPVPAQMRLPGEVWYRGTADAIYQNVNLIEQSDPHVVAIFGADHIYRMNIREMIEYHEEKRADVTVAAIPVPKELAGEFGVIVTDSSGRILEFREKDPNAPTMPGNPDFVLASMGNYIFKKSTLVRELEDDHAKESSDHDFGKNILPGLVGRAEIFAYDFNTNRIPGDPPDQPAYWRDVGTIDAYYEASMDLRSVTPSLNLYNRQWPLRTAGYEDPPAKFVFDEEGRRGMAVESIIGGGSIISGGYVKGSILGRGVRVFDGAVVENSILFDNCRIDKGAKVRRAILDKNVVVPDGATFGYDLAADKAKRCVTITDSGLVVVEGERSRVSLSTLNI